jgi:hypothetical protein
MVSFSSKHDLVPDLLSYQVPCALHRRTVRSQEEHCMKYSLVILALSLAGCASQPVDPVIAAKNRAAFQESYRERLEHRESIVCSTNNYWVVCR